MIGKNASAKFALLLFLFTFSCGKSTDKKSNADVGIESDVESEEDENPAGVFQTKITSELLMPRIQSVGTPDVVPTKIVMQFAMDVQDKIPMAARKATVFKIVPEIAGSLEFKTQSTLEFTPNKPFSPQTKYQVSLKSVETKDGVMTPTKPWSMEFTTPEFAFLGASGGFLNAKANKAEVDIRFSGAVNPQLADKAVWHIDDERLPENAITYTKGTAPHLVHAFISDPRVLENRTLKLEVDGVQSLVSEKPIVQKGLAYIPLRAAPEIKILQVSHREGPTGFYLEVVCYDNASKGGYRYFYTHNYNSYRVSRRCRPSKESIERHISISPKVKNMRVAAGEGGFNILGDFKRGNYSVEVKSGLQSVDGGLLARAYENTFTIPARSPSLRFTNKGRYLPTKSWKTIPIQSLNTPEINVAIRHVKKRNIAFWLSGAKENLDSRTSAVVAKEKIKLAGKSDIKGITGLDIHTLVKDPEPGVYEISVAGPKGAADSTRVVVTDLNLIVKRSEPKKGALWADEIIVWALEMETNRAKAGVEIKLIRKNGDIFSTCKTKNDGSCKLENPGKDLDEDPPFAIIAESKNDFTFVKYDQVRTSPTTSGVPFLSSEKYHAAVYADRNVYRPGETGHFVALVRNRKSVAPKKGLPVEVKFYDPRRKFLKSRMLRTNEAGAVTIDQTFPDYASTGAYSFTVGVGKKILKTYTFNVEEFVPERLKVSTEIKEKNYLLSDPIDVSIQAKYLFGGSAKGSNIELTCRLETSVFKSEKYADYKFGSEIGDKSAIDMGAIKGVLGEEGKLDIACPKNPATESRSGVFQLTATTAVFEAGSGRSSSSIAKTTTHANTHYIGLKTSAKNARVGETFKVEGVVVDWKGKIKTDVKEVDVEFLRLEYDYYWYRNDTTSGGDSWGRNMRPVVTGTKKVKVVNGKFNVSMTPGSYASRYVVSVKNQKTSADISVQANGWSYYYYNHRSSLDYTPRPQRPTAVPIKVPDFVEIDKEAEVTIEVPFAGRMLVTVETSSILKSEWMDVKAGKVTWKYTPKTFNPNIYFSALVVKDPFLDSKESFMPDRAFGLKSVKVKPTTKVHELTIQAPKEVRPNSKLDIEINVGKANANTFVTVAAIDEGILSLTRYKTPDLTDQLFAKRKLGVETFETIGWAIQRNGAGPSGKTGGGAWDEDGKFGDGLGRVMPVKPVALWSGLVEVDGDGKAKVSFDVPTYRGALRVMAISMDNKKTGTADAQVIVRDPLVLQATLPRFLSATDEIEIPVFITNTTGKTKDVVITIDVENKTPLGSRKMDLETVSFLTPQSVTVSAKNDESKTALFRIKAFEQAGSAKFTITAKADGFESYTEGEVPFRPSGPRETKTTVVELSKGTTNISDQLTGWVPTSEKTSIWVTTNPYGRAFDHLKYVIRYPYGCIEQTTSSTRPLLFVSEFVKNADPETLKKLGGIEKMIDSGIRRVLSMQTSSGGFSYWPGSYKPDAWGTAYATDMLLDAKTKGYEVPEKRLEDAVNYLEMTAQNMRRSRSDYAEPYMHFVLAKAGRANRARIQSLIDRPKYNVSVKQHKENVYLLQAALYLAGDRRYEKQLKNVDVSTIDNERESRWSYYSDRRRRAFVLSIYFDLFGKTKDGEKLAKLVASSLSEKGSRYYTTQELTWGITGLGKWLTGSAKSMGTPALKIDSKALSADNVAKTSKESSWVVPRASEYENISVTVPSKNGKVYAVISSTGVRDGAVAKTGGEGLSIARTYFDLKGTELEPDEYKLGDIVFVRITITNKTNRDLFNLALVDRFAAGFEVENPSFGRGTLPVWAKTTPAWNVQHMNVRDDRIEAFGTIGSKRTVTLMYTARAVSAGQFFAPAPEIEGMYEPEIWAREEPSIVKVKRD